MISPCHARACTKPADIRVGDLLLLCAYHFNRREQHLCAVPGCRTHRHEVAS